MEEILFQIKYDRDVILDGIGSIWDCRYFNGARPMGEVEDFIIDAKEFAEFVQIDTEILETERKIIIQFYQPRNFVFFDLAKEQMERLVARCDAIRFRNVESNVYDCIIELYFLKTPDKTVQIG